MKRQSAPVAVEDQFQDLPNRVGQRRAFLAKLGKAAGLIGLTAASATMLSGESVCTASHVCDQNFFCDSPFNCYHMHSVECSQPY